MPARVQQKQGLSMIIHHSVRGLECRYIMCILQIQGLPFAPVHYYTLELLNHTCDTQQNMFFSCNTIATCSSFVYEHMWQIKDIYRYQDVKHLVRTRDSFAVISMETSHLSLYPLATGRVCDTLLYPELLALLPRRRPHCCT